MPHSTVPYLPCYASIEYKCAHRGRRTDQSTFSDSTARNSRVEAPQLCPQIIPYRPRGFVSSLNKCRRGGIGRRLALPDCSKLPLTRTPVVSHSGVVDDFKSIPSRQGYKADHDAYRRMTSTEVSWVQTPSTTFVLLRHIHSPSRPSSDCSTTVSCWNEPRRLLKP